MNVSFAGKYEEEPSWKEHCMLTESCLIRKSYFSENAFSNHLLSKKHKDLEFNADQEPLPSPVIAHKKNGRLFSDTEEDTDTDSVVSSHPDPDLRQECCMFCNIDNGDFDTNLKHMSLVHGFFLPDIEYLDDPCGLVDYLAEKVDNCICLYCNGRGKEYKSREAVRKHMVRSGWLYGQERQTDLDTWPQLDKGHCKMAYDESENPEHLLKFYDFGTMSQEDFEAATVDTVSNEDDELILESGQRLGHRRFMRYYKQSVRRSSQDESADQLSITQGEAGVAVEPRNRKERRSKLAITGGSEQDRADMLRRLPEVVQKQHYQRQSSKRDNLVATSRLRIQNPI